jgi:hypothetical protein
MAAKLLNLVALSSLVILACSFGPTPANALSIDSSPNFARHLGHHQLLAKKKRSSTTGRCKPRPSSSALSSSKPVATPHSSSQKAAPTTSKAASTPASTPASNAGSSGQAGGGKVGLGWALGDDPSLKNFVTSKVSAIYSWSPDKPADSDALGLEFAPMLWGTNQISDFQNLVKPGYAHWALGFNEPDLAGQSNLDPGYAASLWQQYIQPLKDQGYSLVSPAVTSGASGIPWLTSFISDCGGCTIDAVAVHWYGTDAQEFISYCENFFTTFNKPIWVTEYACQSFTSAPQCDAAQVQTFMDTVSAWMDSTWYISKYFAFGVMHDMQGVNPLDQLMAADGQPTALGWDYIG